MASDNEHCGDRGRECTITVSNPVLHGMYPDPSWIWDTTREEIVLVNSSFELVPGLPIHTTRDLVTWTRTANAVDEAMSHRLLIDGVEDSGGLYAPTIRRIGGRYVIVCTVARVDEVKALAAGCSQKDIDNCRDAQGNFVIEADELTGPWRGPYWVAGAEGIDPDIFEDGDGTVWWTQTRPALHPQWDGQTEIWTQPIAPGTWTLQDHKTVIWRGYGMDAVWAEGPHLYRVGDYLYLMTAEGSTSFEHSEMIMRTHAPRGFAAALAGFEKNLAAQDIWIEPARDGERSVVGHDNRLFEACKRNPILTHRHLGAGEPVQCVGHADLLLHPTVGWLLACLGIRETPGEEPGETFSYCGRETFVAPVVWQHNPVSWKLDGGEPNKRIDIDDPGWPVVAPGLGRLPEKLVVDVDEDGLPCAVRGVDSAGCDCAAGNNAACPAELIQLDDTRLVGVRGRDDYRFLRVDGQEYAAFTRPEYTMMIHQDSTHAVMVMAEAESGQLTAEITDRGDKRCIALGALGANEWFGLRLHGNRLEFLAGQPASDSIDEGTMPDIALIAHADVTYARIMADCDARFLSTEWAGGFVGCLIGVKRR